MSRFRRKYFLLALAIVAALATIFLRKNETAIAEQRPPPPSITKETEVPHEIELEQSAELLRANQMRNNVD